MSQARNRISLVLLCLSQPGCLPETVISKIQEVFESSFRFDSDSSSILSSAVTAIPEDSVGRSLLRRLEFLLESEYLPYALAPVLLRHLWSRTDVGSVVFGYPGVSPERLVAAAQMLEGACEAVLLRRDVTGSSVVGLARQTRNERLVTHWADCIERFSLDPGQQQQFEPDLGSSIVNHLCDQIGSLRYAATEAIPLGSSDVSPAGQFTPLVRAAVRKLMPESPELMEDPIQNAVRVLNLPASKVQQDPGNLITCLMFYVRSMRADLQAAFDLSTFDGRRCFVDWFLARAAIELAVSDEFLAPIEFERATPSSTVQPEQSTVSIAPQDVFLPDPRTGLNLVGYPRAEMGMGEQLRSCAGALSTTDVPFCLTDFGFGIVASQQDSRYQHLIRPDNPFDVNLFHINADQMPLAWDKLGPRFFRNHYNIGYWEWELSNFPDEWQRSIDLVDEIWAPSQFIKATISKKTTKPVVWMPLAIDFPVPAEFSDIGSSKENFGLPNHAFLFLFSFDFSSFATRKNYWACIRAFRKAFPAGTENVGLVLKTIRHAHHKTEFWDLLRNIGEDRRIHVIDRVLRQQEMRQLIASCDTFVSLHRSEGFGLGMAEAMYLGKPVIATNYSGNVDFTKGDNSCLVDYELVPVNAGEYVFHEGQVWADPNVDQAAIYMNRLAADPDYGKRLGNAASRFIRQQHGCKVIGKRYVKRLSQIGAARALLTSSMDSTDRSSGALQSQRLLQTVVKKLF